jgi:uncharacterized protein (DUF427 family)
MPQAIFNGTVIAESDDTEMVEGNHYFPPDSVKMEFFQPIDRTTVCPWKGTASYYDITVDGETQSGAAWTYREPKDAASNIKEHIAFYKGKVEVKA